MDVGEVASSSHGNDSPTMHLAAATHILTQSEEHKVMPVLSSANLLGCHMIVRDCHTE